MKNLFVAYYRVSTKKQEETHLGLDAQRQAVLNYIKNNGNKLIAEFTEVESGRKNKRPQLREAINLCQSEGATLVVAKLDRLSRSVTLISTLHDTGVDFVCCDAPFADKTTILFLAVIAQREIDLIRERTHEALQSKFRNEPEYRHARQPNGSPNLTKEAQEKGRQLAHKTISEKARAQSVKTIYHLVRPLKEQGLSFYAMAQWLNREGYKTVTGKPFAGIQVRNIWERFNEEEK